MDANDNNNNEKQQQYNNNNNNNDDDSTNITSSYITILGFGSLLSEKSSRLTFPDLKNFRLGRVNNYRRIFGHPASIFFQRGIADLQTKQMSSLSVEYCNDDEENIGFIASVFEVPNDDMMHDGIPSIAFLEREEEFDIIQVPYTELNNDSGENLAHHNDDVVSSDESIIKMGIICTKSTDETYIKKWGKERFDEHFTKYGINTIWNWDKNSGLRPCAVYLRHCYLAAKNMGNECFNSFLDETFLVDRKTTIRQYLKQYPEVLQQLPPSSLIDRYSG